MAERIKERRLAMGYTQEELAKKLGLQKSAIAKYENGRVENIKRSVIKNMAISLECSTSYLMGWNDNYEFHDVNSESYKSFNNIEDFKKAYGKSNLRKNKLEDKILYNMNMLNNDGKKKLLDYSKVLIGNPNFTNNISDNTMVQAAHNDFSNEKEQKNLMIEDLDEL